MCIALYWLFILFDRPQQVYTELTWGLDCVTVYTEFLYLFSVDKTRLELSQYKNNASYIESVKKRIKKYKEIENKSGLRFRFLPIKVTISGFMIVGDIYYAMWFLGESITLSQRNEKISNEIVNLLKRNHDVSRQGMSASCNDILTQLGILP